MAQKFGDVGKKGADLLKKEFDAGKNQLEVVAKGANGVTFTSTNEDDAKDGLTSTLKIKYANKAQGLTITETWASSNELTFKAESNNSALGGVKVNFEGKYMEKPVAAESRKVAIGSFEYVADAFTFEGNLSHGANDDPKKGVANGVQAGVSVTGAASGFTGGAEVKHMVNDKLTKVNTKLGYADSNYNVTFKSEAGKKGELFNKFGVGFMAKATSDIDVAGDVTLESGKPQPVVQVAGKFKLDDYSYGKAKFEAKEGNGTVYLGYNNKLRNSVTLGLYAKIVATNFAKGDNGASYGVKLAFDCKE
jgi:voltage-dependent anion channel protein 2